MGEVLGLVADFNITSEEFEVRLNHTLRGHYIINDPVQSHILVGDEGPGVIGGELHPDAFDTLPTLHLASSV